MKLLASLSWSRKVDLEDKFNYHECNVFFFFLEIIELNINRYYITLSQSICNIVFFNEILTTKTWLNALFPNDWFLKLYSRYSEEKFE